MEGVHDNVSAFIKKWKEKFRKRSELDWNKVCWREVENELFENKAAKMSKGSLKLVSAISYHIFIFTK